MTMAVAGRIRGRVEGSSHGQPVIETSEGDVSQHCHISAGRRRGGAARITSHVAREIRSRFEVWDMRHCAWDVPVWDV